ncbi:MAG: hypothetical protein JF567_08060 [Xanthomonadales bacterium]|nr:hypothetical protein [Xanthomonadales bacterium]
MEPQTAETSPPAPQETPPLRSNWLDWLLGALRHEPTHALTLFYIGTSALGLWASYWFFRSFGIPVMDYMDPSDYITAGLRDPMYFLMIIAALALTFLLNFKEYARRKGPVYYQQVRNTHWWGRVLMPFPYRPARGNWVSRLLGWGGFSMPTAITFGVVWATMWMTFGYVQNKAEGIRAGGGHVVRITLAHTHDPQPGTARLLGTIGDFVFLYWPEQKRAEAIAVEEVGRIESLATGDNAAKTPAAPATPTPAH